jgi:predicted kinase
MGQLFIALVGHNASGKTYIARKLEADHGLNRVNADDFRLFVSEHIRYFHNLDISIKNARFEQLKNLSLTYRYEMSWLLLDAGQNVIYDGSGATKVWRAEYLNYVKEHYPNVTTVLIYADIAENELLHRLEQRGKNWQVQYHTNKKELFQPPTPDEADILLTYNQRNYDEIHSQLKRLTGEGQA